ncbi:MAG: hypothetical protein ISP10_04465 [Aeromicrobium sp.]|jgi:hypothetical protein|nr:hypothetical protein [Aeromicrobium sp.]
MDWASVPALAAATVMLVFGLGAMARPASLRWVGVSAVSALGASEIRAVFGGMFVALAAGCLITRDPLVCAVVGAAWFADVMVRVASTFIDRVPARQSVVVIAIGLSVGAGLASGYWLL